MMNKMREKMELKQRAVNRHLLNRLMHHILTMRGEFKSAEGGSHGQRLGHHSYFVGRFGHLCSSVFDRTKGVRESIFSNKLSVSGLAPSVVYVIIFFISGQS